MVVVKTQIRLWPFIYPPCTRWPIGSAHIQILNATVEQMEVYEHSSYHLFFFFLCSLSYTITHSCQCFFYVFLTLVFFFFECVMELCWIGQSNPKWILLQVYIYTYEMGQEEKEEELAAAAAYVWNVSRLSISDYHPVPIRDELLAFCSSGGGTRHMVPNTIGRRPRALFTM